MILDEFVEINVVTSNVKFYKEKGYAIPQRYSKRYKRMVDDLPCVISVKPEDLSPRSHVKVHVACDMCGRPNYITYDAYNMSVSHYGYYTCNECSRVKVSKTRKSFSKETWESILQKRNETYKNLYGDYVFGHAPISDEKREQTCMEKYGKKTTLLVPEFQEKRKQTNLIKYGTVEPLFNPEAREKRDQTILLKYGKPHQMQVDEIKNKVAETIFKRYGVHNILQLEENREKAMNVLYQNGLIRSSRQQRHICNLYNGELNYPLRGYAMDVALLCEKIDVEYDGSGHRLAVKTGLLTDEEYNEKELDREIHLQDEGWRIMRIISTNDNLPSDEILLDMFQYAKSYFLNYPQEYVIVFDIDKGTVSSLDKLIPYDFGPLRKIKQEDLETKALS